MKNALRMRPDRIVVGECRGGEALDMLQAMNTGHDGSLTTVHANSPRDALRRLETLVLDGRHRPADARASASRWPRRSTSSSRCRATTTAGAAHVSLQEINGMEGDVITTQELFSFDYRRGLGPDGRHLGSLQPNGLRPRFTDRLADAGVSVPTHWFAPHTRSA